MNIQVGEILTLDNDKEYACVAVQAYKGANYLFLVSNFTPVEIRFAKEIINENGIDLEMVNNQQEKIELMELFQKSMPTFEQ